jgi:hypothetical protein
LPYSFVIFACQVAKNTESAYMTVTVERLHSLSGHRDRVYALAPSHQPGIFFSAGADGLVIRWNLDHPDEGEVVARLPQPVYALHTLPSGQLIVGHNFEGIHVINWKDKEKAGSLQFTRAPIFDLLTAGNRLFVASGDGCITEIHLTDLRVIRSARVSEKNARCLSLNTRTGELAAGFSDAHIRIFDLEKLTLKHEIPAHQPSVFTVRYTPSEAYMLSAGRDARIKAWEVGSGYTCLGEVVAHMYTINHLEFSPDKKYFVTCSLDKSIKVWELSTLTLLKVIDRTRYGGHGTSVNRLLWLEEDGYLVSASDDRTLSVWRIEVQ